MTKFAPRIFQLFGVVMALNLVFLLAANGETNLYSQAATLAAVGAAGATSPVARAALFSAAVQNANNQKKAESPKEKEEGRAATTAAAAPTPATTNLNLSSVPDALKDTAVSEPASPLAASATDMSSPGGIAKLIAQETAHIKLVNEDAADRRAQATKDQIADITADFQNKTIQEVREKQAKVTEMLGLDQEKKEEPQVKRATLSDKIVATARTASEETRTLRDKLKAKTEKKVEALSLEGITAQ